MAFVVKVAKTLRNHWKKTTFFAVVSGYGIKYGYNRQEENLLRRVYCAEAKKFGDVKITNAERPRRVTVFLNPAAHDGKARKLFEKTAGPILYLAGIEVNVVRSEYEGQVKKFISVLEEDDTDAIIVAGGDGTLIETVTGILRKEEKKFHNIPVGVIPLGNTNTFARLFYGTEKDAVRMMADAAMAVVHNVTKKVDVLKIDGGEGKTTYALCGMEIGTYRDAEERKSKYWYFGPLKSRWTHVRTTMMDWPPVIKARVSYVEATAENMAYVAEEEQAVRRASGLGSLFRGRSLWTFWKRNPDPDKIEREKRQKMMKEREDEEDSGRVDRDLSTVELTLMSPIMRLQDKEPLPGIQLSIGPSEPTRTELISEGWSRIKETVPKYGSDKNEQILVKNVSIALDLPEDKIEPTWYNIDGESFEAIPVKVSLLQKKLNVFQPVFEPPSPAPNS